MTRPPTLGKKEIATQAEEMQKKDEAMEKKDEAMQKKDEEIALLKAQLHKRCSHQVKKCLPCLDLPCTAVRRKGTRRSRVLCGFNQCTSNA